MCGSERYAVLSDDVTSRELVRQVPTQNQLEALILSFGDTPKPPQKKGWMQMNRNPKEKYARIEIRAKPKDKEKIQKLAGKCNLSVSEYMVKRALGYEPRAVPSDAFFEFYDRLCQLANRELLPEVESELLTLIDEIHSELLLPGMERDATPWLPQDSGPSKAD